MTDALQQRSRYQCALKNAPLLREFLLLQCSKLRRLKLSMIENGKVTEGTFKQKTRIKIPVSSISIISLILSICP